MSTIQRALEQVRERVADACIRVNRSPTSVTLIAVSKTFPAEAVIEATDAGQRDFGENRVEEALGKIERVEQRFVDRSLSSSDSFIHWHLIGHVQSRKTRDVAGRFHLIHSVDSLRLAAKLNATCTTRNCVQDVLLECNVSGETSKEGFPLADWQRDPPVLEKFVRDVAQIIALPNVRVRGLMTIAPIVEHPDQARPTFASLCALRDAVRERLPSAMWDHLSMGMTDDFEAAIAEGATMVRIGRAIFGARE